MSLDPDLRAQLASGPSTHAWERTRHWFSAANLSGESAAQALAEAQAALSDWPAADRAASAEEWARIAAGGHPPIWWPLVRAVTIGEFADLRPLKALSDIVSLSFDQRAATVHAVDLAALPALRELALGSLGDDALATLPPLPHLLRLSMTSCGLPQDFAQRFPALQALSLSRSERLTQLPALPVDLQSLDLSGCKSLTDLAPVADCKALWQLDLRGCDSIQSLQPLRALPQLSHLRRDGDDARER